MRIHDAYTKLDRAHRVGDAPKAAVGSATTSESAAGATHVKVSLRARDLSALASPRAAKVDALRAQLERGELHVDASAITAKLLGDLGS